MPNINRTGNVHCVNSHYEMFQSNNQMSTIDYSYEEERIKSFVSWPVHYPVDPIRLAKAGFYYSGKDDEVICFSCNGQIKNWNYGDIVQKKHSTLFPTCDFVNGRSNNIPLNSKEKQKPDIKLNDTAEVSTTKVLTELMKSIDYDKMKFIDERLKTYASWPVKSLDPLKLAQAGFFYLGCEDKVQCPFCKGVVSNWELDDDPLQEHKKHFPWCDFLSCEKKDLSVLNTPWFQTESEDLCGAMKESKLSQNTFNCKLLNKDQEHINLEKLGVQPYNSPKHPQQASISARLRTFISWPSSVPVSKEEIAKAGFFYIGIEDNTKCFHCNGGLCNWEEGDDPWVEHAKWYPNCHFLRLNKGEEFITTCVKDRSSDNRKVNTESSLEHAATFFCSEPLMVKVDEAMKSNMVKYVLESGLFPPYIVRVAVLRQIEETGSNFSDMNELCLAVNFLKETMGKLTLNREESLALNNLDIRKCSISNAESNTESSQVNQSENSSNVCSPSNTAVNLNGESAVNKTKGESSKDQCLCKICMDNEVGIVFLPCGHLLACAECAAAMELCPMCRKPIQATFRAYLP